MWPCHGRTYGHVDKQQDSHPVRDGITRTHTQRRPPYRSVDNHACDRLGDTVRSARRWSCVLPSLWFTTSNSVHLPVSCISVYLRLCSNISLIALTLNVIWVNLRYVRETLDFTCHVQNCNNFLMRSAMSDVYALPHNHAPLLDSVESYEHIRVRLC